jgi:5-methylcytosine-specific restriction endonuclease McrA
VPAKNAHSWLDLSGEYPRIFERNGKICHRLPPDGRSIKRAGRGARLLRSPVWFRQCLFCRKQFVARFHWKKYCSAACASKGRRLASIQADTRVKICRVCRKEHRKKIGVSFGKYCSDACRRAFRRTAGAYKNAMARSLSGEMKTELVDPEIVFRIQRYKCQRCGIECDRSGQHRMRAPTLDHIKPIARGGEHTWDNVQTLCMLCNNKKHARLEAILRRGPRNSGQVELFFEE